LDAPSQAPCPYLGLAQIASFETESQLLFPHTILQIPWNVHPEAKAELILCDVGW